MNTVADRITSRMNALNIKGVDITNTIGASSGTISQWRNGTNVPGNQYLLPLAELLQCDPDWLMYGDGGKAPAPSVPSHREDLIPAQQTVQILPKGVHPTDIHQRIEIYDVRLAAGPEGKGSTVEWIVRPEDDPLYFRHGWFKARRLTARNLRAMYVRGDSMEPYLYNHDTIIIDTTDTELSDGEVYAITYNGHMLVKELRATPDGVRIISRNPAYEPIEYQGGEGAPDFQIIGHVVWRGG